MGPAAGRPERWRAVRWRPVRPDRDGLPSRRGQDECRVLATAIRGRTAGRAPDAAVGLQSRATQDARGASRPDRATRPLRGPAGASRAAGPEVRTARGGAVGVRGTLRPAGAAICADCRLPRRLARRSGRCAAQAATGGGVGLRRAADAGRLDRVGPGALSPRRRDGCRTAGPLPRVGAAGCRRAGPWRGRGFARTGGAGHIQKHLRVRTPDDADGSGNGRRAPDGAGGRDRVGQDGGGDLAVRAPVRGRRSRWRLLRPAHPVKCRADGGAADTGDGRGVRGGDRAGHAGRARIPAGRRGGGASHRSVGRALARRAA